MSKISHDAPIGAAKKVAGDVEQRFRVRWNADHQQVAQEFDSVVGVLNWISAQYAPSGQRSPWCFAQVFTFDPEEGWQYVGTGEMCQKWIRRTWPELHKKHFKMGAGGRPDQTPAEHFQRGNPERRSA